MSDTFFRNIEKIKSTGKSAKEISIALGKGENFITLAKSKFYNEGIPVSKDVIALVELKFKDVLDEYPKGYINTRREDKLRPKKKEIPFFDAPAEAGMLTETEMTPIHAPSGTIDVGDLLSDSEAAMRIYGNSMNPNYPPGCVLGLLPYLDSSIEPGEVYVIETKSARRLKRLFYKDDEPDSEYLLCYSDNTMKFSGGARDGKLAYPPYFLHKSEIVRLFAVTGVIKRNLNSVIINR